MHVIRGVEIDGGESLLMQAQKHLEIVAVVGQGARRAHIRLVKVGAAVVVLDEGERPGQRSAGNKDKPHPVMHYAVWNVRAYASRLGFKFFYQDLAPLELIISL